MVRLIRQSHLTAKKDAHVKKDAHSTHGVAGNACAEAVAVEPHPLADALD